MWSSGDQGRKRSKAGTELYCSSTDIKLQRLWVFDAGMICRLCGFHGAGIDAGGKVKDW